MHSSTPSFSTSPHDPHCRPSASILANAHEAPAPSEVKAKTSKRSALKAAFIPAQPGRKIKTDGRPLGKSFERTTPLPANTKISGGQILDRDPRGDTGVRGGLMLIPQRSSPSLSFDDSNESAPAPSKDGTSSDEMASGSYCGDNSSSTNVNRSRRRGRTNIMSIQDSQATSQSSSSYAASIRFAPLPVSGRLKRANSITIGVAARSQLLRSQGLGRNSMFLPQPPPPPLPHGMSWQQQQQQASGARPSKSSGIGQAHGGKLSQSARHNGAARSDDVVDLGEEISKRWRSAWKRMRGSSGSESDASVGAEADLQTSEPSATATPNQGKASVASSSTPSIAHDFSSRPRASVEDTTGESTPRRRPASPTTLAQKGADTAGAMAGLSKMSLEERDSKIETQGSYHDHFPLHRHPHHHKGYDERTEGNSTPRQSVHRRLSTGAFLKNASLRGMQEERRREVLGVYAASEQVGEGDLHGHVHNGHAHGDGDPHNVGGHLSDGQQQAYPDEEQRAAAFKQGLGRTGATIVLGPLALRPLMGGDGSADDSDLREGLSTSATVKNRKRSRGSVVVGSANPKEGEFHTDDFGNEEMEDEEEKLQEAQRLAKQSLTAGSKPSGVEIVD